MTHTFTNKKGISYIFLDVPEDAREFKVFNDEQPYLSYFKGVETPRQYLPQGNYELIGLAKDVGESKAAEKAVPKHDNTNSYAYTNEQVELACKGFFTAGAEWEAEREKWLPIETAPKDGTKITVAIIDGNENHYYPTTASWRCYHQNSKGKEMFRDQKGIKLEKLTHWKPLTPPKIK